MRKLVLLAAAVPLLCSPAALATDDEKAEPKSVCRAPDVALDYDAQTFSAVVSLPATGCASREHTIFDLSAVITRVDNSGQSRDFTERSMTCGPFRSAADRESHEAPAQYFCDLALFLPHPELETAQYTVDVTYPAASGDPRTMSVFTVCTSDAETAVCEH